MTQENANRRKQRFTPGQRVHARLGRNGEVVMGGDVIRDGWRYTVLRITPTRVGIDDGDPETLWPADLFEAGR
jgi:hypothetical protein